MTQKKAEKKKPAKKAPKKTSKTNGPKKPPSFRYDDEFVKQMPAKTIARMLNDQHDHLNEILNPGPFSLNTLPVLYATAEAVALWVSMGLVVAPPEKIANLSLEQRKALATNHVRDLCTYIGMPRERASEMLQRLERAMSIIGEHGDTMRAAVLGARKDKRTQKERLMGVIPALIEPWMATIQAIIGPMPKAARTAKSSKGKSKRRPPVPGL